MAEETQVMATATATATATEKPERIPGIATIKPQYVIRHAPSRQQADDDAAEAGTGPSRSAETVRPVPDAPSNPPRDGQPAEAVTAPALADGTVATGEGEQDGDQEPPAKRVRLSGAQRKKAAKERKREHGGKGQNKGRHFARTSDEVRLCPYTAKGVPCERANGCKFGHDLRAYLRVKPRDIYLRALPADVEHAYRSEPPYVSALTRPKSVPISENPDAGSVDPLHASLDLSTYCPLFAARGQCEQGWKCRFLGAHVRVVGSSSAASSNETGEGKEATGFEATGLELVVDEQKVKELEDKPEEINYLPMGVTKQLRSKKYHLPYTKAVLAKIQAERLLDDKSPTQQLIHPPIIISASDLERSAPKAPAVQISGNMDDVDLEELENEMRNRAQAQSRQADAAHSTDGGVDVARVRPAEKRRLDWAGKLYLAPLTTTGNLPFRRVCAGFGSDIHCGEMGLAQSYLTGAASEWSLVRRWEGERTFGVQLAGGKPELLIPTAEVLARELGSSGLDFVDVNCGCPIDLVFNSGAGSALLDHTTKLSKIMRGMNAVLGEIPLTIKLRTGTTGKNTTHKLFPRLQTEFGVSAATLHGRSRKQRYAKSADWNYIRTCADALRENIRAHNEDPAHADEEDLHPIPIFGNGDVYSWQDYYENLENAKVDGEMVARGALIKPWIFTEIKERRDWDISSRERLDIVRQYATYGLSHWGSDTQGVNTTRRFLCEALSFTHRYVPLGILEHLPARLNDRPPPYKGRDELETLLASTDSNDWVRISEMFLGKAPEGWQFTPKHKSNSFADGPREDEDGQG